MKPRKRTNIVFTLQSIKSRIETRNFYSWLNRKAMVFTLQSIKSRIETSDDKATHIQLLWFLLYSPLNQGLKPITANPLIEYTCVFTLQSIKSRIETFLLPSGQIILLSVFTLQSIKSRIETFVKQSVFCSVLLSFYSTVH